MALALQDKSARNFAGLKLCTTGLSQHFGLIENMSGCTCPHCGEMIELFGSGGGEKTAYATGISFLGRVPFDPNMVACGDSGTSYQDQYKDSAVSIAFGKVAEKMARLVSG